MEQTCLLSAKCYYNIWRHNHLFSFALFLGFPEAGPRAADPTGTCQQPVPPPCQGEPHWPSKPAQSHGPRGQPALGHPAPQSGRHPPQTQGAGLDRGRDTALLFGIHRAILSSLYCLLCNKYMERYLLITFFLHLSISPPRGRTLRAPGRACWCGWLSWTCSSPTSNTFQRATSITRYSSSTWGQTVATETHTHTHRRSWLLYGDTTGSNLSSV